MAIATHTLLATLLTKAGIDPAVQHIQPLSASGLTNRMSLVELKDGRRLVLREYHWPHAVKDLDRVCKERFLHRLLQEYGVPVPAILAEHQQGDQAAILMEHVPGELLGSSDAVSSLGMCICLVCCWSCSPTRSRD
jgi:aminoglycoside phosphotransferase (APT) family kinase protein